ncbi:hypothetical protein F5884DRAFT_810882 [Xylogone sp. PMI_703]|nr:hypothetical protein F5884DRAFT_810882 [Xylogone sp. PMI_703]
MAVRWVVNCCLTGLTRRLLYRRRCGVLGDAGTRKRNHFRIASHSHNYCVWTNVSSTAPWKTIVSRSEYIPSLRFRMHFLLYARDYIFLVFLYFLIITIAHFLLYTFMLAIDMPIAIDTADMLDQLQSKTRPATKKTEKPASRGRPTSTATQPPKLFEKVGTDMIDLLVKDLRIPHDTPTLLDRLQHLGVISVQSSLDSLQKSTTAISTERGKAFHPSLLNATSENQIQQQAICTPGTNAIISSSSHNLDKKIQHHSNIFSLGDFAAVYALSGLADSYGRVSHMGILDQSYRFFITRNLDAALYFKVKNNICLVGGDPLCPKELYSELLEQFAQYRRKNRWGIIFVGASDEFVSYARQQKWTTIQFGTERVLNPTTNPVLREETSKRIATQNRQLLNPSKGGITLGIYNPSIVKDLELERKLVAGYDAWRDARNQSKSPQAFITVYDPFAIPGLMTYIYTKDAGGTPNGFAVLRRIGANNGFHVDPCIAAPSAPRGISDLLIFTSMALLNAAGCTYLSFGYEPLTESGEINGMQSWMERLTRRIHNSVFKGLKVSGKKGYHDKWCPDEEQRTGVHLIFPSGIPGPQDIFAVVHFANISIRSLLFAKMKKGLSREKDEKAPAKNEENAEEKKEGAVIKET